MPGSYARRPLFLKPIQRFEDTALLLLRVLVGAFLVWGVSDNLVSAGRMQEFQNFLAGAGFIWPGIMAPLSGTGSETLSRTA